MSYENNKCLQIGKGVKGEKQQGHFRYCVMELWQEEGGQTLEILVGIKKEAFGCLLTKIDLGVFEHDRPL